MKILVISGSTRRGSLNGRLAALVADLRPGDTAVVVDDLDRLPFYNADLEALGVPPAVAKVRRAVAGADAIVFITPEYNSSVPGVLGNAIDWLSRPPRSSALAARPVLVLSASPTRFGGARAAEHLRTVLGHIGAVVFPYGLSVGEAHRRLGAGPADTVDPAVLQDLTDVLSHSLDGLPKAQSGARPEASPATSAA